MFRLIPREEKFYGFFNEQAILAHRAARLLQKILEEPEHAKDTYLLLKKAEEEADNQVREVFKKLGQTFITPLDREDITVLTRQLDNIVDIIDSVGRRMTIVAKALGGSLDFLVLLLPHTRNLVAKLVHATQELPGVVSCLRNPDRQAILQHHTTAHGLENQADAIWEGEGGVLEVYIGDLVVDLGAPTTKGNLLLREWKDLCHSIEEAIDLVKNTVDTVSSIIDKFA